MLPHQFQELLDKYSRGACSEQEEQLINAWYDNIGKGKHVDVRSEITEAVGERIWASVKPRQSRTRTFLPWLTRAAIISIPLLACAAFFLNRQTLSTIIPAPLQQALQTEGAPRVFTNHTGSPRVIALADGSEVRLQPLSELRINTAFGENTREVELKGEAFFNVSRNPEKPFVVYANEVVTRVLGTSFNIRAYDEDREITVAVKTGKVSVYTTHNKTSSTDRQDKYEEVILTPNQQMVYHRAIEKVSKKLVEEPEIIIPGSDLFKMQFENTQVSNIFHVLEENYGIEIRYDQAILKDCRLTTSMSDEGLYDRIAVICKAIGASYSIDDGAVITIHSDGC